MEGGWNIPDKKGIWQFMVGAVIGFLLFLMVFIQDTESTVFSANLSGDDTLRSLRCPEIITRGETGTISAKIVNHSDKRLYRYVRTHISQGFLTLKREYNEHFYMEPGETRTLSWEVSSEDAAWGYLVLAKVYVFPQKPYPSYAGACGITSLNLPKVRGWQLIVGIVTLSVFLMGTGYVQFARANKRLVGKKLSFANNMKVIAATVLLANATMFLELWFIELIFFIFTIILLAESAFQFSQN
jgi:hypothetical protein